MPNVFEYAAAVLPYAVGFGGYHACRWLRLRFRGARWTVRR